MSKTKVWLTFSGTRCIVDVFAVVGYIQLITSLLSIFYTTSQFAYRIRLLQNEEDQIIFFSMATVALIIWRTLIVGSRILAFVLFATFFHCWLFVVVGFHCLLMFAMVFYQMWLCNQKSISDKVATVIIPLVYIFDFCVNWLEGPTFYWYLFCYVPMYSENVLMSGLVLWYVSTTPSLAWYIVPGCVSVIVMFPLGIIVQLAYYRRWHPNVPNNIWRGDMDMEPSLTTWLRPMSWSDFRDSLTKINKQYSDQHQHQILIQRVNNYVL